MPHLDGLIRDYERTVTLPWNARLAGPQKVWIAMYAPGEERRLRARLAEFEVVTRRAGHGWLLLPGGLPATSLPIGMTEVRKGRCARLKATAHVTDQQTLPWHWDHSVQIAFAPGIDCYEAGKEYEHGGLTPQECVTPVLVVSHSSAAATQHATIESVTWRNLRCTVKLSGATAGMTVDIRTKPANPATSITTGAKAPDASGAVSLLVPDDDQLEAAAQVVVLAADGSVHTQTLTTVGG